MAELIGPWISAGNTSKVSTPSAEHAVGTRAFDADGNEYIYLKGVASCVAGSWVSFDEGGTTILTAANAKGRVGVAMAAIVASTWGWFQIYGKNTIALSSTAISDNAQLYLSATAGKIADDDVAGDLVIGAIARGTAGISSPFTVELNYPIVIDVAID